MRPPLYRTHDLSFSDLNIDIVQMPLRPQAMYRPQTACGRYCPWEPTALHSCE
jgi:hypothetical protein